MNSFLIAIMALAFVQADPTPTAPSATPAASATPAVAPPAAAPAKTNGGEKPAADAIPTVDPLTYTYNPFGKRDPFRSYLIDHDGEKKDFSDPLLNYDLTKFKLTGVLSGVANPRAIVKDGDNHGHIITKGTRMGRNKGQVISITRDKIVVAEEFRDPLGKLIVSEYTMKLENEKRGKK